MEWGGRRSDCCSRLLKGGRLCLCRWLHHLQGTPLAGCAAPAAVAADRAGQLSLGLLGCRGSGLEGKWGAKCFSNPACHLS